MKLPERPIAADWLALREPVDARTRDAAADALLPVLVEQLSGSAGPLHVVDLGAGTGANARWLGPRLPRPQRWTLVDHDRELLADRKVPDSRSVLADVSDLDGLLSSTERVDLVTSAALLDLLRPDEVRAVVAALVAHAVPALLSLSVTGDVDLDPADPDDQVVAAAFDAHQMRGGRLGPRAAEGAADLLLAAGWRVTAVSTPWLLGHGDERLSAAWLAGRAEAAVESQPELQELAGGWLVRRDRQLVEGTLGARVGHTDLLALPPAGLPADAARDDE